MFYRINHIEKALTRLDDEYTLIQQRAVCAMVSACQLLTLDEILHDRSAVIESITKTLQKDFDYFGLKLEDLQIESIEMPFALQKSLARAPLARLESASNSMMAQNDLDIAQLFKEA